MFSWYRDSEICYVYLDDVELLSVGIVPDSLEQSRWFTRGWTLQELIAPDEVVFFDANWKELGSRKSLIKLISRVTGIDAPFFIHRILGSYSIAQRMSWASRRCTTRLEDEAYCLMGLFGVSMPLLYGEGTMAFIRLQEEIMKRSDDQSIFAWNSDEHSERGFLATSVSHFRGCGAVSKVQDRNMTPFLLTNKGIQISLPIVEPESGYQIPFVPDGKSTLTGGGGVSLSFTPSSSIALLNCQIKGLRVGVPVERESLLTPYYRSIHGIGLVYIKEEDVARVGRTQTILIESAMPRDQASLQKRGSFFILRYVLDTDKGFSYKPRKTAGSWIISAAGAMSVRVFRSDRTSQAYVFFADEKEGQEGFVIFLHEKGYWDLKTNIKEADINFVAEEFSRQSVDKLSQRPSITKRLQRANKVPLEVSLTAQKRHHGVTFTLSFKEPVHDPRKGVDLTWISNMVSSRPSVEPAGETSSH